MRGPSAGIRRRCPCNLAKSPCISPNCRERQVGFGLPAQPPSRGFSGSLPTFLNKCGRSAEIRHRMAVFPRKLTPERGSRCASAGFLALYLFWAFLGVTLEHQLDASVMLSWGLILLAAVQLGGRGGRAKPAPLRAAQAVASVGDARPAQRGRGALPARYSRSPARPALESAGCDASSASTEPLAARPQRRIR